MTKSVRLARKQRNGSRTVAYLARGAVCEACCSTATTTGWGSRVERTPSAFRLGCVAVGIGDGHLRVGDGQALFGMMMMMMMSNIESDTERGECCGNSS